MFKLYDLKCNTCETTFEDLLDVEYKDVQLAHTNCPECGAINCEIVFTGCRVNTMGCLTKEGYAEKMAKRSVEHSKMLRKQERFS